jgi:hypothetical protein
VILLSSLRVQFTPVTTETQARFDWETRFTPVTTLPLIETEARFDWEYPVSHIFVEDRFLGCK